MIQAMTELPKISIVTPSFRSACTIEDTILSVLSQGYPNLEYIIVDGAGGDETASILKRYDEKLSWWCSEPDEGQYHAIAKGFAHSSGEILAWINADDVLLPKSLWVVAEVFSGLPQAHWISTLNPGFIDADGYLCEFGMLPGFSRQAFLDGFYLPTTRNRGQWIQQESTFFRRSLWEISNHALLDSNLAGDFCLWCEFYKHAELLGIARPLGCFRFRQGQRSEDITTYLSDATIALEALRVSLAWRPKPGGVDLRYSPIGRIPRIGRKFSDRYGYQGHRITRRSRKLQNAPWIIEKHRWLPS